MSRCHCCVRVCRFWIVFICLSAVPSTSAFICNSTICNVICDTTAQCQNLTIDASQSAIFNLQCNATQSCDGVNVTAGPSDAANLYCAGIDACKSAVFNLNRTTESVQFQCEHRVADTDFACFGVHLFADIASQIDVFCDLQSCKSAEFHLGHAGSAALVFGYGAGAMAVIHGQHIQQWLNVSCTDAHACNNTAIYADGMNRTQTGLRVFCKTQFSCENTQILCPLGNAECHVKCQNSYHPCDSVDVFVENALFPVDLECDRGGGCSEDFTIRCRDTGNASVLQYSSGSLYALQCASDGCCPPQLSALCVPDMPCQVNCSQTDCAQRYIDGSLSTSLTILCDTFKACYKTLILCPSNSASESSECRIHCSGHESCTQAEVDALSSDALYLSCLAPAACTALRVREGPLREVTIDCLGGPVDGGRPGGSACSDAVFALSNTSEVHIDCVTGGDFTWSNGCQSAIVEATYSDLFTLNCGYLDCYHMQLWLNHSQSATVNCNNNRSCEELQVFAEFAADLNLRCSAPLSCSYTSVHCPYLERGACAIDCADSHACDSLQTVVADDYAYNYLDLLCQQNDSCSGMQFYCDKTNYTQLQISMEQVVGCKLQLDDDLASSCCPWQNSSQTTAPVFPVISTSISADLSATETTIATATNITDDVVKVQQVDEEIVEQSQQLTSTFTVVLAGVLLFFFVIALAAFLDARLLRVNDYFKLFAVLTAGLQFMDTVSDCFFAVDVSIQAQTDGILYIALALCAVFIVFPILLSLLQLHFHLQKHWSSSDADDRLRFYLTKYSKQLLLVSMLFGGSFTAISLLNSNMFNLEIFSMGLTQQQIRKFGTKRVYSIVLFENLPQLGLQIWFLFGAVRDTSNVIAISAMILSLLSILISVMSMCMEKTLINSQQYVVVTVEVTGNDVVANMETCKTRTKALRALLCSLIGVDTRVAEITKPVVIPKGLRLQMFVYVNGKNVHKEYTRCLHEALDNGQLEAFFNQHWKIRKTVVSSIDVNVCEAKDQLNQDYEVREPLSQTSNLQLAGTAHQWHHVA